MKGKIVLQSVNLGSNIRPLFQDTFFTSKGTYWELFLLDGFVHIIDKTPNRMRHGIVHSSNCTMELVEGGVIPEKPRRGRPPKKRPTEATN